MVFSQSNSINAVIGDKSWVEKFGETPTKGSQELERIKTHLSFVLATLQKSEAPSSELNSNREYYLELLEQYIKLKRFPSSLDPLKEERRPCFIDNEGRTCAVAFLVENTAGREEAERLNTLFKYEYLLDMKDANLLKWQKQSGLSLKELAMIQPTYQMPRYRRVFYNQKKGKYGTQELGSDKILIKAKYDAIILGSPANFINKFPGIEMVRDGEKWGVLDGNGKVLHKFIYDSIYGSSRQSPLQSIVSRHVEHHEYLAAYKDNEMFIIDIHGKTLISQKKSRLEYYNRPFFTFVHEGKVGLIHINGEVFLPAIYKDADVVRKVKMHCMRGARYDPRPFEPEAIKIRNENGYGLLNMNLEPIISPIYERLDRVSSKAWCGRIGQKRILFDLNGQEQKLGDIRNIELFSDCKLADLIININGKLGVLDSNLEWKLPPEFDDISERGLFFTVRKGDSMGMYHRSGRNFLPVVYNVINRNSNGNIFVSRNRKYGLLDPRGEPIIELKHSRMFPMSFYHKDPKEKCWAVCYEKKWQLLDAVGRPISEQEYDSIRPFGSNTFWVKLDGYFYAGQYREGKVVFNRSNAYEAIVSVAPYTYAYTQNGKIGFKLALEDIFDETALLSKPLFDSIATFRLAGNERFLIKYNGKYGIVNQKGEFATNPEFDTYFDPTVNYNRYALYLHKEDGWYHYSVSGDVLKKVNEADTKRLWRKIQKSKTKK